MVVASSRPSASVTAKVRLPPSGACRPRAPIRASSSRAWRGGDRQPVHPPRRRGGAGQRVQGGGDGQVRGDPGLAVPAGAAQQQREQLGADLRRSAAGRRRPWPSGPAHRAARRPPPPHRRRSSAPRVAIPSGPGCRNTSAQRFGLLPARVRGGGVPLQQQLQRPGLQPGHRQIDRLRQQHRLDRPRQLRAGGAEHVGQRRGPRQVQVAGGERAVGGGQVLGPHPGPVVQMVGGAPAAVEHQRQLGGEELTHPHRSRARRPSPASGPPGCPAAGRRRPG